MTSQPPLSQQLGPTSTIRSVKKRPPSQPPVGSEMWKLDGLAHSVLQVLFIKRHLDQSDSTEPTHHTKKKNLLFQPDFNYGVAATQDYSQASTGSSVFSNGLDYDLVSNTDSQSSHLQSTDEADADVVAGYIALKMLEENSFLWGALDTPQTTPPPIFQRLLLVLLGNYIIDAAQNQPTSSDSTPDENTIWQLGSAAYILEAGFLELPLDLVTVYIELLRELRTQIYIYAYLNGDSTHRCKMAFLKNLESPAGGCISAQLMDEFQSLLKSRLQEIQTILHNSDGDIMQVAYMFPFDGFSDDVAAFIAILSKLLAIDYSPKTVRDTVRNAKQKGHQPLWNLYSNMSKIESALSDQTMDDKVTDTNDNSDSHDATAQENALHSKLTMSVPSWEQSVVPNQLREWIGEMLDSNGSDTTLSDSFELSLRSRKGARKSMKRARIESDESTMSNELVPCTPVTQSHKRIPANIASDKSTTILSKTSSIPVGTATPTFIRNSETSSSQEDDDTAYFSNTREAELMRKVARIHKEQRIFHQKQLEMERRNEKMQNRILVALDNLTNAIKNINSNTIQHQAKAPANTMARNRRHFNQNDGTGLKKPTTSTTATLRQASSAKTNQRSRSVFKRRIQLSETNSDSFSQPNLYSSYFQQGSPQFENELHFDNSESNAFALPLSRPASVNGLQQSSSYTAKPTSNDGISDMINSPQFDDGSSSDHDQDSNQVNAISDSGMYGSILDAQKLSDSQRRIKWKGYEVDDLNKALGLYGHRWSFISKLVRSDGQMAFPGRSADQILHKFVQESLRRQRLGLRLGNFRYGLDKTEGK
ncbi:hypothetical protein BDEG_24190 [Batrachochytrium dendrobatidis JEL423]|uniref:Uncharacterized protein n=2 Tax=Batrachochytrium dendrobatidis (strain JEL423) TaxID=403673 RepID=A0A177WKW8_BATDL|nr:hypothetical protein BDEG_24190 [Batrachochytrium dendrobatidis JEL423]